MNPDERKADATPYCVGILNFLRTSAQSKISADARKSMAEFCTCQFAETLFCRLTRLDLIRWFALAPFERILRSLHLLERILRRYAGDNQ
jgi:histone H3/H4